MHRGVRRWNIHREHRNKFTEDVTGPPQETFIQRTMPQHKKGAQAKCGTRMVRLQAVGTCGSPELPGMKTSCIHSCMHTE